MEHLFATFTEACDYQVPEQLGYLPASLPRIPTLPPGVLLL
jgi:hypothetical protein